MEELQTSRQMPVNPIRTLTNKKENGGKDPGVTRLKEEDHKTTKEIEEEKEPKKKP